MGRSRVIRSFLGKPFRAVRFDISASVPVEEPESFANKQTDQGQ